MFDIKTWGMLPFQFWTFCFFVLGAVAGSFLNVCIYRMPRGESIIRPPSHCPHCGYTIPWYLNIPLVTWCWLGGQCANCKARISVRYFAVELLTALVFAGCWIHFGHGSPAAAVVYCIFVSGLIVATFIDFDHLVIPDEITFGGMAVAFVASFLVPSSHFRFATFRPDMSTSEAMIDSIAGMAAGGGVVYAILRMGKLMFGRHRMALPPGTKIVFTETAVKLPDEEIAYEELFYRSGDCVRLQAASVELVDRCYPAVAVCLRPDRLTIGADTFDPDKVPFMEAVTDQITLPREAMGPGDVKFMAAIGGFIGWEGAMFTLAVSALIGSVVGLGLIAVNKRNWSSRMPYGPYIALAAVIWLFDGPGCVRLLYRLFGALPHLI